MIRKCLPMLRLDFETRLKNELHHSNRVKRVKTIRYMSIAASIIVLVMTLGYVYNESRKEQLEVRDNLVLALGEDQSNSIRI